MMRPNSHKYTNLSRLERALDRLYRWGVSCQLTMRKTTEGSVFFVTVLRKSGG